MVFEMKKTSLVILRLPFKPKDLMRFFTPLRSVQNDRSLHIALVFMFFALLGCAGELKPYHHPTYGFHIKYPKTWDVRENTDGAAVVFVSPKETPLDLYSENLSVVVQELKGRMMPLGEYTQEAIYQITQTFKKEIQVTGSNDLTLSARPAHRFEYIIKNHLQIKKSRVAR